MATEPDTFRRGSARLKTTEPSAAIFRRPRAEIFGNKAAGPAGPPRRGLQEAGRFQKGPGGECLGGCGRRRQNRPRGPVGLLWSFPSPARLRHGDRS